ncbi:tetratricopeptide repeat protein [Paraglaciecola sp.]|uniref:tetratricopeptide repeat protein n=1 Tax=Paraglaciecola sp. TaxID=1920173 RepID=UPI003EF7B1D2
MERFLSELRRRKVIKSLVAYVGIAWVILQVVSVIAGMLPINPLIAPGILLFLTCGLPVAMYLSWHFDFSFEGIKRTPNLDELENPIITPFGIGRWIGLAAVLVVSNLIGMQYLDSIKKEQLAAQEGLNTVKLADSIAVIPFTDQSPEQDQKYLALGLAEEITSLLGRSEEFKVSASRSSQVLADKGLTPMDIGRRLKVKTVLTGSVHAIGSRLKIRVELLDTENGYTLWTKNFLRELKDIFDIQSEIGRAIVNLLQNKYLEAGSFQTLSNTSSSDAYVMYLKGREEYRKQTTESMKAARTLFEQAVALDPEYAKGYVGLADTLVLLAEGATRFGVIKTDIAATLAQQSIDKALVRQPQMPEAYAVKGYISFMRNNFDSALEDYNKALQLNPSLAIVYMWKSLALNSLQRFDEAILAQQKAQELDPLFLTSTYNLGMLLSWRGRYDDAQAIFNQLHTDFPESPFPHQGLADTYFSKGNLVGAISEGKKALKLSPDDEGLAHKLIGPVLQLGLTEIVKEKENDPVWKNAIEYYYESILIFDKDFKTLFEHLDFKLAANPDDYWIRFEAGWYHAMIGDKNKALNLFTEQTNRIDEIDKFGMPHCSPAIEIAWAQKELGKEEDAHKLFNKCTMLMDEQLESSITYSELHYLAARLYALQYKSDKAIQALSTAIDNGWREWWTQHDPLLANLEEQPEFQKLIQFLDDDLLRQKAEVVALFAEE